MEPTKELLIEVGHLVAGIEDYNGDYPFGKTLKKTLKIGLFLGLVCISVPFRAHAKCPSHVKSLCDKSDQLQSRNPSQDESNTYDPPLRKNITLLLFFVFIGLSLCGFGIKNLDDKRPLIGSSIIFIGWLCFSGSMVWLVIFGLGLPW